jgi:cytochrome c
MQVWEKAGWQCLIFTISLLWLAGIALTQEKATPQEVKTKVTEAAKLLAEKGEEGIKIINQKDGPFVWKDTYVFSYSLDGKINGHPVAPHLIGKDMMAVKDVDGKIFSAEFLEIVKGKGHGWSDYKWPKPGSKEPSLKVSYVMKVDGKDWFVGAGIYDVTKEEAIKQVGD